MTTENPSNGSSSNFNDPFDMLSGSEYSKDLPSFRSIQTKERSSVFFDNSVPSTPVYSNTSPNRSSSGGFFDSHLTEDPFARFDSFSSSITSDAKHSTSSFTRFDSFSSYTNDAKPTSNNFVKFDSFSNNHPGGMTHDTRSSFDYNDPFSNTGPFGSTKTSRDTLGS